jgi:hypothetical protein
MKTLLAFTSILFFANLASSYERSLSCSGKKGAKIAELKIMISGTENEVVEKSEMPATALALKIKLGKTSEKDIKFVGNASNSAKGIYYELKPAPGVKSAIKEIFISAPASNSESTITSVTDKEYSVDCQ